MMKKQILRSIASITKRVGGDLASPIIDKICPAETKTFSGELIVADGTHDSFSGDILIEGKTLQNILPSFNDASVYIHSSGVTVENDNSLRFRKIDENHHRFYSVMNKIEFGLNRNYSILYDLYGNVIGFDALYFPESFDSMLTSSPNPIKQGDNGRYIKTVKVDTTKSGKNKGISFTFAPNSGPDITNALFKNVMLIHGEHTGNYNINYFSGIHSLGENGKLYIKCSNKNLCTKSNNFKEGDLIAMQPRETKIEYKNGEAIITKLTTGQGRHVNIGPPIFLESGKTYYIVAELSSSDGSNTTIALRNDYNGGFLIQSNITSSPIKYVTCTPSESGFYSPSITTTALGVNSSITVKSCYAGTVPMGDSFVPYEENIIEIPLSEPLRSIDTMGISDKIMRAGNKYYIKRETGKFIFDGATKGRWLLHEKSSKTICFVTEIIKDKAMKCENTTMVCGVSSLNIMQPHYLIFSESVNYETGTSLSQSARVYVRMLLNDKLDTDDLEGFKKYITENPFYVIYPLKEPIYEEIELDNLQVELYPEQSIISAHDEVLSGKTTIDVPMNIMSIISNDIRKINSLEKELINAEKTVLLETMNLISIDEQFNNHKQKI